MVDVLERKEAENKQGSQRWEGVSQPELRSLIAEGKWTHWGSTRCYYQTVVSETQ